MKKLLNTLYVTTQHAYLKKEGESVVVMIDNETRLHLPIHTLDGIVTFGAISISPYLLHHCAKNNVTVSYLSEYGQFLARVHGPVSGNVLLRREQYRMADIDDMCLEISKSMLKGKIHNSRAVIRRALRDHSEKVNIDKMKFVELRLSHYLNKIDSIDDIESLRGVEGDAAGNYFSVFQEMTTTDDPEFFFSGRNKRPPKDRVNALLSYIYTILSHDCRSALEGVGLDPYVGFLHKDRPGRSSLALDLMEEFRSFLADRLVLTLINRKQLTGKDFINTGSGAVTMKEDARKTILSEWQKKKQDEITHPYLEEKIKIGMIPHIQAQLLARYIRGDIDGYPAFLWK